ncbi:hypothetical protein M404DRAFT_1001775 [Pisolithus tinctorius Marx 270]|uniref:Uncharacterized protein n=1 Tax=Pisolithus tinctorius Marx 270 TaxID=870435 RepID=A0A0C3P6F1_PISTI|nr:hypothetical protein M404DRAFT_1001775 [Pisolithus tinctorius Marx 270]
MFFPTIISCPGMWQCGAEDTLTCQGDLRETIAISEPCSRPQVSSTFSLTIGIRP